MGMQAIIEMNADEMTVEFADNLKNFFTGDLINNISKTPFTGIGKPELLK